MPYEQPFLFVDKILELTETGARGEYTFKKDEYFYRGHFKNNPITPGVILVECMAQIGLVSLGLFLLRDEIENLPKIAFSSAKVDFLKMVLPGQKVIVQSEKKYFRLGKLNCNVVMEDDSGDAICRGVLTGFILNPKS